MNFKQKMSVGMATGTAVASMFSAVAFADTVTVNNNGNGSVNGALLVDVQVTSVEQSNETVIVNEVKTSGNTGGNDVNGNNGSGKKAVKTGNVVNNVNVTNRSGSNVYTNDCGCPDDDVHVNIKHNGNKSLNLVGVVKWNQKSVNQSNASVFVNGVYTGGNTGDNEVKANNGAGAKKVKTGKVRNNVWVKNVSGSNMAY